MPPAAPQKPPRTGLTRRRLLIGGGVGAGLVVGFALWPRQAALNLVARPGETILGGWLKVGSDGRVTILCPQAEMGQGVWTALPQLLADELGADWRTVAVEPAPLHGLYANRAMAGGMAEALPGFLHGVGRWAATQVVEHYAVQVTGGSTSVAAYYAPLRDAGAAARALLCKAAARRWDVDWEACDTRAGFVVHESKRLRFAELAALAAEEKAPSSPVWRADTRATTGRSAPRLDVPAKVDGSARFGADVRLPDMAYAAVRGGPIEGGALVSVDDDPARSRPGVLSVVRGSNFVAVVARTWWTAKTALDALDPKFRRTGRAASSDWIDAALDKAVAGDGLGVLRDDGEVDAGLGRNPLVATYRVPYQAHACLEPMTATARLVGDRAEVWTPTQSVTLSNWAVARALGIPETDVTIFPTLIGGGFGRKAETDACVQAALIARAAKRPVQLIWSREEDFAQDKFRPAAVARLSASLDPAKRIAALDIRVAAPVPGPGFMRRNLPALANDGGPSAQATTGLSDTPYAVTALRVSHVDPPIPVPIGFWRSVENSYTGFFIESFVDELANAAGVDPLTFRLRLLEGKPRHAEVLKVAASRGGLMGAADDGAARGLAMHESFGSIVAMVAEVQVAPDTGIAVRRVTCAVDCGRVVNPDIVRQQVEGSIIFALTAALKGAISFADGMPEQTNFDAYPLLTLVETPEIEVILIPSTEPPAGVGEPGVPPVAPAVANAVFAATGVRLRDLPLKVEA